MPEGPRVFGTARVSKRPQGLPVPHHMVPLCLPIRYGNRMKRPPATNADGAGRVARNRNDCRSGSRRDHSRPGRRSNRNRSSRLPCGRRRGRIWDNGGRRMVIRTTLGPETVNPVVKTAENCGQQPEKQNQRDQEQQTLDQRPQAIQKLGTPLALLLLLVGRR